MSYDIYGEPLRRGHCEVHPHVHEEYPCSVCRAQKEAQDRTYARMPTYPEPYENERLRNAAASALAACERVNRVVDGVDFAALAAGLRDALAQEQA